ncbi:MAG: cysteine desulfurase family protein [Flavobacteriaceae bacterium]|nr:cysteine desulfurase family protein [Flavobacteriaceae bacterium]
MNKVYLDNAATTPLNEEVIESMIAVMRNQYGNPSSIHSIGQEAKSLIEETRRNIAQHLGVTPKEIIFTSCGTESNNMIIKSSVEYLEVQRIISSPMEHKCVVETCLEMKNRKNVELVYVKHLKNGEVDIEHLEKLLQSSDKKTLVSLMHANNEVGNLLDIDKVAQLCQKHNALFHSDTVQTIGHLDLDFSKTLVDFASCSAHKFHGPKGVGFAFIRKTSGLKGLIVGGPQERSLRAGTENVCGIVGLGKALDISIQNLEKYQQYIRQIKDYAIEQLSQSFPKIKFNGNSALADKSLYTVLNVALPFKNPLIGLQLDMKGIAVSQGSACSSGAGKPSMVLMMLQTEEEMDTTTPLRISFSHQTQKEDIDALVNALEEIVSENKIDIINH